MSRTPRVIGLVAVTGLVAAMTAATPAEASVKPRGPKNVIVMISDGAGYNTLATADYYQHGRTGHQVYEQFPVRAGMSTYTVDGSYDPAAAWGSFDHVTSGATDSAAAATAMSTGFKTYDGAIGVGPAKSPLVHAFQKAEVTGRSTGVVSTVEFSHATPAGFVAHNVTRNDYSGIANEMIYRSATDVIIGAGNPCYDDNGVSNNCAGTTKYVGGATTWADLTDADGALGGDADGDGTPDPWTLVQTRRQFQALAHGRTPSRLIGIPRAAATFQQARTCTTVKANPITGVDACVDAPYATPVNAGVPTLSEATATALNVLDDNRHGFALMIEGGAVDQAAHNNAEGRMIEEEIDFNRAVETVVSWIGRHGGWADTLLVVTGDHETGYLTGPGSNPTRTPVVNRGRGRMPLVEFHSGGHTNSLIPLYAQGPGAALLAQVADEKDPVRGHYLDNAELGRTLGQVLAVPARR